uniref:Uncharacterized protein n=1 Tax=Utricularia reniformis TaxID=192314 RepID=A0A1Y0B4Q3_9LAMI|nr:hypothetical protein AEK19_MT2218 [Utricularia reniformis]ART32364.1 hypothetical protein AEK19_MT2218 [Utricularia reniformis]
MKSRLFARSQLPSKVFPLIIEGSQDNKGRRRLPLIDIAGESLTQEYSAAISLIIKRLLYTL